VTKWFFSRVQRSSTEITPSSRYTWVAVGREVWSGVTFTRTKVPAHAWGKGLCLSVRGSVISSGFYSGNVKGTTVELHVITDL